MFRILLAALVSCASIAAVRGDTIFLEAEAMTASSAGWVVASGPETRAASGLATLHGASGPADATASTSVHLKDGGHYRVWVRFHAHLKYRGPFQVAVL